MLLPITEKICTLSGMAKYSHREAIKLLNEVRSALANLDTEDRNPAIRAALTIGWMDEEAMSERGAKKRWGEGSPGDILEILGGIGNQLAQMDPDDVSDIVTVGLNVVNRAVEAFNNNLPVPEFEFLTNMAIEDFKAEKGREPRLGWWEDPLSTEHPAQEAETEED